MFPHRQLKVDPCPYYESVIQLRRSDVRRRDRFHDRWELLIQAVVRTSNSAPRRPPHVPPALYSRGCTPRMVGPGRNWQRENSRFLWHSSIEMVNTIRRIISWSYGVIPLAQFGTACGPVEVPARSNHSQVRSIKLREAVIKYPIISLIKITKVKR